jgi:hypothetical protein
VEVGRDGRRDAPKGAGVYLAGDLARGIWSCAASDGASLTLNTSPVWPSIAVRHGPRTHIRANACTLSKH